MSTAEASKTIYSLEGSLIEACSCNVNCPCWIGEDPDLGECFAIVAYGIDRGQIRRRRRLRAQPGADLSHPRQRAGRQLAASWRWSTSAAREQQREAMLGAFTGKLGGPLGDLWTALIGEVKGVEFVPIHHQVAGGSGTPARAGHGRDRDGALPGPDGSITTLQNSVFSTVPGSPAWIAKAGVNRVSLPAVRHELGVRRPQRYPVGVEDRARGMTAVASQRQPARAAHTLAGDRPRSPPPGRWRSLPRLTDTGGGLHHDTLIGRRPAAVAAAAPVPGRLAGDVRGDDAAERACR